jgi:hypothetical protein
MPETHTDYKTRAQPTERATGGVAVAPLPEKTLARRRRLIRYGGVMTFLLAIGLSAIPGPKGSSNTITVVTERGVQTQVRQFFFSRHFGLPFTTGRIDYEDNGAVKKVSVKGPGFLGNLGVAFAIVVALSIFMGRRRRDD